jgi:hypothetical protein
VWPAQRRPLVSTKRQREVLLGASQCQCHVYATTCRRKRRGREKSSLCTSFVRASPGGPVHARQSPEAWHVRDVLCCHVLTAWPVLPTHHPSPRCLTERASPVHLQRPYDGSSSEPAVHCVRGAAPHLGQVPQGLGLALRLRGLNSRLGG